MKLVQNCAEISGRLAEQLLRSISLQIRHNPTTPITPSQKFLFRKGALFICNFVSNRPRQILLLEIEVKATKIQDLVNCV